MTTEAPFAFVVEDRQGEAQTIRPTVTEALKGIIDCNDYYHEAETCGHPAAPGWVKKKRPFTIRPITQDEHDRILEDGTPVLDREP